MICSEFGLSEPHRYWLEIGAGPSRIVFNFKMFRCSCNSSKVANKVQFAILSNPISVSSSLFCRVRYQKL
jgi:hypothetical protein